MVDDWDEKTRQARLLKARFTKVQQGRPSTSSAKTLLKNNKKDATRKHQDGEDGKPPPGADDDRVLSIKKHVEDRIRHRKHETKEIEDERILSNKNVPKIAFP